MSEKATSLNILVIEGDADTRAKLQDILELDGYCVETAGRAAEVLQRQDWSRFTAIILDRKLPDGSAEDLLPRLQRLAPHAAVIIATGYADVQSAVTALRLGAADYILKPINADELRARLGQVAERFHAEEKVRTLTTLSAESPSPNLRVAADGTLVYANNASRTALGTLGLQARPATNRRPVEACSGASWSGSACSGEGRGRVRRARLLPPHRPPCRSRVHQCVRPRRHRAPGGRAGPSGGTEQGARDQ